jgi:hypothetical protein
MQITVRFRSLAVHLCRSLGRLVKYFRRIGFVGVRLLFHQLCWYQHSADWIITSGGFAYSARGPLDAHKEQGPFSYTSRTLLVYSPYTSRSSLWPLWLFHYTGVEATKNDIDVCYSQALTQLNSHLCLKKKDIIARNFKRAQVNPYNQHQPWRI